MIRRFFVVLTAGPALLAACSGSSGGDSHPVTGAPPSEVTLVARGGFQSPTDAVASLDGKEFYFAAFDSDHLAAIYQVSSERGAKAEKVAAGAPLDMPIGLVLSCDGSTLYVADLGTGDGTGGEPVEENGAILSMSIGGGQLTNLHVSGLERPSGLAMSPDCNSLVVTGKSADGLPALARVPLAGGTAEMIWMGAPLVAPTGVHVDDKGVAWVMDHLAQGEIGEGVLFKIPTDGSAVDEVTSNLKMGTPGGVSLTSGGGTAVMTTLDAAGKGQLTNIDLETGEVSYTKPKNDHLLEPSGLRTAREAGVFVVVDTEAGAIYRAD